MNDELPVEKTLCNKCPRYGSRLDGTGNVYCYCTDKYGSGVPIGKNHCVKPICNNAEDKSKRCLNAVKTEGCNEKE